MDGWMNMEGQMDRRVDRSVGEQMKRRVDGTDR